MPVTNAEEAVIFNNVKNVGEKGAFEMGLSFQGSRHLQELVLGDVATASRVSNQIMQNQVQSSFQIGNALLTVLTMFLAGHSKGQLEVDPVEAISTVKTMTGDDVAQKLLNMLGAQAGAQQQIKAAQTTNPPTGV
jgi:hypothetical protein